MSLWTTTYYDILKNYALPQKNLQFDDLINATYNQFFNFNFPFYNTVADDKVNFEKLFLQKNLMNYIGQETLELHRMMLSARLKEIMPYYTQMWQTLALDMDWINNVDVTYTENEEGNRNTLGNSSRDTESISGNEINNQVIDSDNPQITIKTEDYASNMSRGQSTSNGNSTESSKDSSDVTENNTRTNDRTEKGYRGILRGDVVKQMRESIYNINQNIIRDCKDLFLGVW